MSNLIYIIIAIVIITFVTYGILRNSLYKKKVKLSTIKAVNNTKINLFRTYFGIFFPPLIKSINMHNAI